MLSGYCTDGICILAAQWLSNVTNHNMLSHATGLLLEMVSSSGNATVTCENVRGPVSWQVVELVGSKEWGKGAGKRNRTEMGRDWGMSIVGKRRSSVLAAPPIP